MDLYSMLNVDKQTTKTSKTNNTSLEGTIKKRINEVIHGTLLNEFPQYYKNIDSTTIVKSKDGKLDKLTEVNGYKLLVPMDEQVEISNGNKKVVMEKAVKVATPQIYLQGIQNHTCEYVKIGGKTTLWNQKKSEFVEK